jgi:hypothetical protein
MTMKFTCLWAVIGLCIISIGFLGGCATVRHPGPLGEVGDLIEDYPIARYALVLIILGILGAIRRNHK